MAKLTRKQLLQFGSTGPTSKFGQFGSLVAGAALNTKDPLTIQSLTAWLNGLQDALYGANKAPLMEDFNGLLYVAFYQLCYNLQNGIPEWDSATTYYTGSVVMSPSTGLVYVSLVDNNTGNALPAVGVSANASWQWGFQIPAANIFGSILDSQIAALAASKLTGTVADAQIAGMSSTKLIGNVLDAQITSIAASKLTGALPAGSVHQSTLATATGSLSGSGASNVVMNDYSFFPNIQGTGTPNLFAYNESDSGDTIGRYTMGSVTNFAHRWRYVASSDNPRIWLIVNKDGEIKQAWESEDPPNHAEVADGFDETCPFQESQLEHGDRIVKSTIVPWSETREFLKGSSKAAMDSVMERYERIIEKKGWDDEFDKSKFDMANHWLLRHTFGKTNTAKAIRTAMRYSFTDGKIYFVKEYADKIRPDHIEL